MYHYTNVISETAGLDSK